MQTRSEVGQKRPKLLRLPTAQSTTSTWAGSCQEETSGRRLLRLANA
jgi:hypothetical protein